MSTLDAGQDPISANRAVRSRSGNESGEAVLGPVVFRLKLCPDSGEVLRRGVEYGMSVVEARSEVGRVERVCPAVATWGREERPRPGVGRGGAYMRTVNSLERLRIWGSTEAVHNLVACRNMESEV